MTDDGGARGARRSRSDGRKGAGGPGQPTGGTAGAGRRTGRRAEPVQVRVDPRRVRVVHGNDEFLVGRAVGEIVRASRADAPDLEVSQRDAAEIGEADLMELVSPSLFGGARLVVIRDARAAGDAVAAALLAVAADPPDEVVLVVTDTAPAPGNRAATAGSGTVTATSRATAAGRAVVPALIAGGATTTECRGPATARDRVGFVRDEVARAGATITSDAAALLVDVVGSETRELAAAAAQLVSDLAEPGRGLLLTGTDVERFHRGHAEVSAFAIADLTVAGDSVSALEMVRRAEVLGVHPLLVADALASGVRSLARVASAAGNRTLSTADAEQVGRQLKIPGWKVRRLSAVAREWTPQGLVAAARVTADINTALKGAGTVADDQYTLESAVRTIVANRGVTTRPQASR